jgi:uncharacterized protein (TIGR00369 family)
LNVKISAVAACELRSVRSTQYNNWPWRNFNPAVQELHVEEFERRVRESFRRQAFMATLGAEIAIRQVGEVEIRFRFHPSLTQQNDFVHAGAITSILDSACGYAALSVAPEGHDVLSVEFKVNFLSPAVGEEFCARSHVKRAGKTLTVCAADAYAKKNGEEKLIATMLATIIAAKRIA